MKNFIYIILFFVVNAATSQKIKTNSQEIEVNSLIKGTLFSPEEVTNKTKLVILIAGSGPTNRSGNSTMGGINNSLKFLAEGLAGNGIAVFSYDKRIFAQMIAKTLDEKTLSFEDFINDAKDVITYFKLQKKYTKIIIAGHSEGSLIGMVAALNTADGYVSIAGAGRGIDEVLSEQIAKQSPSMKETVDKGLASLKEGKTFENKNPMLASIFRESVQPYMISWIKYNPQVEIKKLTIPILLINGTKDLQVPASDAELLHVANSKSELKIIENMNHIFKEITVDENNLKSYSDPNLPVIPELINAITTFVISV
ncbi:alpha/beta hydrolase [Flavobacterium sp.]|uniref:alpha/beta hydrolase n=1 Tax=Flavobacterium sp. TaxID=239 RepID=UPI003BECBFD1